MKTPPRYSSASLEHTAITPAQLDATLKDRRGIYLHGPVGTGKTYIAYAIGKYLEERTPPLRVVFYNATELIADIRHDFDASDPYAKKHAADRLMEADKALIIIDDLGAEKPSEWVAETVYRILNHRYEHMLPVVITSNLSLDQLAQRLGDRVASRLAELCDIIELTGRDRRLSSNE